MLLGCQMSRQKIGIRTAFAENQSKKVWRLTAQKSVKGTSPIYLTEL